MVDLMERVGADVLCSDMESIAHVGEWRATAEVGKVCLSNHTVRGDNCSGAVPLSSAIESR